MCCNLKCHLSQFTTKTLVSLNKKCNFEHYSEVQTAKNILINIFCHEIVFL